MPELRPIKLTDLTLPDGRRVDVFVDIDDAALNAQIATTVLPGTGSWPLLPFAYGTLSLRVVERS